VLGINEPVDLWAEFFWSGISFGVMPFFPFTDILIPFPEFLTQCNLTIDIFKKSATVEDVGKILIHWSVFHADPPVIFHGMFSPVEARHEPHFSHHQRHNIRLLKFIDSPITGKPAYKVLPITAILAFRREILIPAEISPLMKQHAYLQDTCDSIYKRKALKASTVFQLNIVLSGIHSMYGNNNLWCKIFFNGSTETHKKINLPGLQTDESSAET